MGPPTPGHDADIGHAVRQLIRRLAPALRAESQLADDLPLAQDGVGLDSLGIIDLLLACESVFEIEFPVEFLNDGQLTVGDVIAHVDRARAGSEAQ